MESFHIADGLDFERVQRPSFVEGVTLMDRRTPYPDADVASLDDDTVDTLHRLGGDKLVRQLVELFERLAPARLSSIRAAVRNADAETVQFEAHALKSNSGNVGATRMAALCQRLELLATSGDLSGASELTLSLDDEFSRVAPRLRGHFEGRAA